MQKIKCFFAITLLSTLIVSCAIEDLNKSKISSLGNNKTLLSIYMVGGNLEDDVKPRNGIPDEQEKGTISTAGAGSNDLRELIEGYQNLSEDEKNKLDILVAFGGSRKKGWKGVKYADIKCILKDSEDRYFGNDSCYEYSNEKSNMANEETLEAFLKFTKNKYENDSRKVLDLWDHGFAYLGMGQDSLNGNDLISLKKLKTAMKNSSSKFNLLSFDACLMGSIEVSKTVKDFSDFMVASEELEPSHGFNYTDYISILAKNDSSSFDIIGKKIVDSYIDSPKHKEEFSKNKTLSVVSLKEVDNTIKKLDLFSSALNFQDFSKLLNAVEDTQKFGTIGKSDLSYTIDLINWVNNVKNTDKQVSSYAQAVLDSLSKLVIYSRHDSSKPNSNGISVYSLSKNMIGKYGIDETFSNKWLDFSRSFINFGSNDIISPTVTEGSFSAKGESTSNCNENGKSGYCLNIFDDIGLRSVEEVFALKTDERYLFMLGSNQLKTIDNDKKYFSPEWNGEWFLLCDGDCNNNLSVFPPAYFNSYTEDDSTIYSTDANLNGEDVVFYFELGKNNNVVSQWAVPYTIGDNGEILLNRNQLNLSKGDKISFYYQVFDTVKNSISWKQGETITFSNNPKFSFASINENKLFYVQAEDYKGNISISKIHEVK